MAKLAYKSENQKQLMLLPPSLDELIPCTHPVRLVDHIIDLLDLSVIHQSYKGGGNSCFSPRMMLKVLVYAYLNNIYSSRRIEQQLRENIHYMWLSGGCRPDFRTINYFRGKRLKDHFEEIFTQVVQYLHTEGFVSLKVQYIDGTKIESCANKYSFVWRGSVEKNAAKLKEKTRMVLAQIEEHAQKEDIESPPPEPISSYDFKSKIERIKSRLDSDKVCKSTKKAIDKVENQYIPRMQRYEEHLDTMQLRNSYSKTDPDATFMRMKEDAMLNGQLKPGYNIQVSSENQFITNYGIYQRPNDTLTLIPFLESFKKKYGFHSEVVVADSGYGSEQNYDYLFANAITPFVKYNMFHKEQKRKYRTNAFLQQNMFYNAKDNYYVCPMGQHLKFIRDGQRRSEADYLSRISIYRASRCQGCPVRGKCHKSKDNRQIEVNHKLNRYKQRVVSLLTSDEGIYHRGKRPVEPEAVFACIKEAGKFRRLRLRGIKGANIEFGLKALAHNIRKLAKIRGEKGLGECFLYCFRCSLHDNRLWELYLGLWAA